jgi:glyoxylate reductase
VLSKLHAVADVDVHRGEGPIPPEELRRRIADKAGLVCFSTDAIDRTVLEAGPQLKVIATVAVGYDNIDVALARSRGAIVSNTPDVLTESVADFTWG